MNPPPLAKRIILLTATVSLLTSFTILFVAIPKGIDEYVEKPESTTTVPLVKGSVSSQMGTLTVGNVTSCAIDYGNGHWVASSDRIGGATSGFITTPSTGSTKVRLYRSSSEPYLVLASTTPNFRMPGTDFIGSSATAKELSTASVIDCINSQPMTVTPTPALIANENDIPVYVSGDVTGLALVMGPGNQILGFVCEHNHAQWFLPPRAFGELFATAR